MERVEWDGSLETGHASVDEQHRELFAIFNEIVDATGSSACDGGNIDELLVRLSDYVSTHFSAEEDLMEFYGYPAELRDEHHRQHADLTSRTRELVLAHRTGGSDTVLPLLALLQEWLAGHIMGTDSLLVAHIHQVRDDDRG